MISIEQKIILFRKKIIYSLFFYLLSQIQIFPSQTDFDKLSSSSDSSQSLIDEDESTQSQEIIDQRSQTSDTDANHQISSQKKHESIHLSETNREKILEKPSEELLHQILDDAYTSKVEFIERMNNYIVGIKGQDNLLTLAKAYQEKIITAEEAGSILDSVKTFKDGETTTLKMKFGLRRGEDIVIGRYPSQLIARPYGNDAFYPGDPSLGPLNKWLQLLGHMTWVNPSNAGSMASVDSNTGFTHNIQLTSLAASISTNHYSERHQRSINGGAYINARSIGGGLGFADPNSMHSLWFSVNSGWGGLGYSGLQNIEEQQLGLSAIGAGTFVAGWKNYAQIGASITAVSSNGNQFELGGVITMSKDRVTLYKHKYAGEYDELIDKYIAAYSHRKNNLNDELMVTNKLATLIRLIDSENANRNTNKEIERIQNEINSLDEKIKKFEEEKIYFNKKHFIEVVDTKSKGLRLQGGAYAGNIGIGFRGGVEQGSQSIYRFYTNLQRAHELLKDGNGDKIALLRLPEKFDTENFPDLREPHLWKPGEEVITTMERTFYGSIVMGITGIPAADLKVGVSSTVTGSFEFGVRKLPGNKLEVTIRPQEIKEMGAFISSISVIGPQAAAASTVALSMRQTFIFDLENQQAVDKYSLMLTGGVLPLEFSLSSAIVGKRESENLLDMAIIARKQLAKNGVLLVYLEKIDVPTKKFYMGAGKIPLLSSNTWAGLSYEYLNGKSKVISTNADIAVSRETSNVNITKSQGTSGIREDGAYVTIKRSFAKLEKEAFNKENAEKNKEQKQKQNRSDQDQDQDVQKYLEDEYKWAFKGVSIRATISDSKITDNEENDIVKLLNSMFHANINYFPKEQKGHKQTREVFIERELTGSDLDLLKHGVKQGTIDTASRASGLNRSELNDFVAKMENKGHNQMANIIKEFIGKEGLKGVSAVHILTNGNCRNLTIRTDSNTYSAPIELATQLEAIYTNAKKSKDDQQHLDLDYESSYNKVRKVYKDLRSVVKDIDNALLYLHYDPFFVGENDLMRFDNSHLREKKSKLRSRLLANKNKINQLLNIKEQGFPKDTILNIYKKLKPKDLDLMQRYTLLQDKYKRKISVHQKRKEITTRWASVTELLKDIEDEIEKYEDHFKQTILGEVFIKENLAKLKELHTLTQRIITTNHLKEDAERFMNKMRKRRFYILPAKPIHHEILGHIESLTLDKSNNEISQKEKKSKSK